MYCFFEFVFVFVTSQSSQSIKIVLELSINKSIKICKSDLIGIDCINQSVEINDTLVSFIDLSRFHRLHQFLSKDTSVLPFIWKWKLISCKQWNLLTIELQLRVEGSNNLLSLFWKKFYKNLILSLKPTLKSSSDGWYCPGFLFFPLFHDLDLSSFQNNLCSKCSYYPE